MSKASSIKNNQNSILSEPLFLAGASFTLLIIASIFTLISQNLLVGVIFLSLGLATLFFSKHKSPEETNTRNLIAIYFVISSLILGIAGSFLFSTIFIITGFLFFALEILKLDRWLTTAVVLVIVAVLSITLVFWVGLVMPIDGQQRQQKTIEINAQQQMQINAPVQIDADKPSSPLTLTLPAQATNTPITVTVIIPDPINVFINEKTTTVTKSFTPNSSIVQIQFNPTTTIQTASLQLVNPLSERGSLLPWVYSPQRQILVSIAGKTAAMDVAIETTSRAALRNFVRTDLAERSPLLLFAAAIVAGAGWLYQERQRAQDQAKQEKDKEKQEKDLAKDKEKQEKAWAKIVEIRELLCQGKIQNADTLNNEFKEIIKEFYNTEHIIITNLLNLNKTLSVDFKFHDEWLTESAGVFIDLIKDHPEKSSPDYANEITREDNVKKRQLIRIFPIYKLNYDLRRIFNEQRDRVVYTPFNKIWPVESNFHTHQKSAMFPKKIEDLNLFPNNRAEHEIELLFNKDNIGLFFPDHPVYQIIESQNIPYLIYGESGVGKTALAQYLGIYHYGKDNILGCYTTGLPDEHDIIRALCQQLLKFICLHPDRLVTFGEYERDLLASCLVSCLGHKFVLAATDRLRSTERFKREMKRPTEIKPEWITEAMMQITLFQENVTNSQVDRNISSIVYLQNINNISKMLDFSVCRIVIDILPECSEEWIKQSINQKLPIWHNTGIQPIIFTNITNTSTMKPDHILQNHELHWKEQEDVLRKFLRHRYKQIFSNDNQEIDDWFGDAQDSSNSEHIITEMIINSDYNPRKLFSIWNSIREKYADCSRINLNMVRSVTSEAK